MCFPEFERLPKMTWLDFISGFGGLCGLCLGISFVSLAEILYWFSIRLWRKLWFCVRGRFDCLNVFSLKDLRLMVLARCPQVVTQGLNVFGMQFLQLTVDSNEVWHFVRLCIILHQKHNWFNPRLDACILVGIFEKKRHSVSTCGDKLFHVAYVQTQRVIEKLSCTLVFRSTLQNGIYHLYALCNGLICIMQWYRIIPLNKCPIINFPAHARSVGARRACALRALGLLLAQWGGGHLLIWFPVCRLVGGCGAQAVSRKTPVYFMIFIFMIVICPPRC